MINAYRLAVPSRNTTDMGEIVVFGEAQVGKTCFVDMLIKGYHFALYVGVGVDDSRHRLSIDGEDVEATFLDLSSTTLRTADANLSPALFTRSLSDAIGVILLYDITSLESFEHITQQGYGYACMCAEYLGEKSGNRVREYILVGNKKDVVLKEPGKRQVDVELAEQWAQSQGMKHVELSTHSREEVTEAVQCLLRSVKRTEGKAKKEQVRYRRQVSQEHGHAKLGTKFKEAIGRLQRNA